MAESHKLRFNNVKRFPEKETNDNTINISDRQKLKSRIELPVLENLTLCAGSDFGLFSSQINTATNKYKGMAIFVFFVGASRKDWAIRAKTTPKIVPNGKRFSLLVEELLFINLFLLASSGFNKRIRSLFGFNKDFM